MGRALMGRALMGLALRAEPYVLCPYGPLDRDPMGRALIAPLGNVFKFLPPALVQSNSCLVHICIFICRYVCIGRNQERSDEPP